MRGSILFTNSDHALARGEVFTSLGVPGARRLVVGECAGTGFLGFGVAITPASCYLLSKMEPGERRALLREIYTDEGLGLSVGRLCIGSSDYSPELYSYDDVAFDTRLEHFSVARDEAYIIPMIKEILEVRPDLYLFASPWSPPYWMKTGGSMCGGYMREAYLDTYADYIVKFIRAYAAHGIKVSAVTPQNEADTQQKGRMPACIWHPETEAKFITLLREKFEKNALDVRIWMYDHNFDGVERVMWSLAHCEGLKQACDGVAFHYYGGAVEQTAQLRKAHPALPLHFTEGGPRLKERYDTDWCKWGVMISRSLRAGYSSFTGWNLMLDELGGPNVGPFIGICAGLVTRDGRDGSLRRSGQYKAFSHIAPYIHADSRIYPLIAAGGFEQCVSKYPYHEHEIEGFLIEQSDGGKVAVLINQNDCGVQTQIEIGDALWYVEMHADSIATVILEK